MKKVLISSILILVIILGGYFMFSDSDKFSKNDNTKAKYHAEKFIYSNYKSIESIEFNELFRTPMGGNIIDGTVNNKSEFYISLDEDLSSVDSIKIDKHFPDRKEECKDKFCE